MKLCGTVSGVPVMILIDSGATHNFVDAQLARRMGWEIVQTPRMTVQMGDGYRTQIQGRCKGIEVAIGEYQFRCNPHLFDLGGPDIVLGIEWLRTLGDTIANWQTQNISFWWEHKWVKLHVIRVEQDSIGALQSILLPSRGQGQLGLRDLGEPTSHDGNAESLTREQQRNLQQLLQDWDQVFQEKKGLPPSRGREHQINIMQGQGPVNVRPYRYPHVQKT